MSEQKPLLSRRLDRRAFLGGAGLTAGAVMASALVPLSLVHAVPAQGSVALTPSPGDPSWNGHVDDVCGHWPPYSHSIPYNVVQSVEHPAAGTFAANVAPVDYFLMTV